MVRFKNHIVLFVIFNDLSSAYLQRSGVWSVLHRIEVYLCGDGQPILCIWNRCRYIVNGYYFKNNPYLSWDYWKSNNNLCNFMYFNYIKKMSSYFLKWKEYVWSICSSISLRASFGCLLFIAFAISAWYSGVLYVVTNSFSLRSLGR